MSSGKIIYSVVGWKLDDFETDTRRPVGWDLNVDLNAASRILRFDDKTKQNVNVNQGTIP